MMTTATALFALGLASGVPTGNQAAAARFEAEAFAALEEQRECDAAISFTQAYALSDDERLLYNAALAYEKHGDYVRALATFSRITDHGLVDQAAQKTAVLTEKERLRPSSVHCPAALSPSTSTTTTTPPPPATTDGPRFLPWSIAAVASGVAVAGAGVAGFVYGQSVLADPRSTGDAKGTAIIASTPVLLIGGSVGGLLIATGAALFVLPEAL